MTAPFPFHPATGPQAPMLRPDPLHEEPGALGSLTPILLHVAQQMQQKQDEDQKMMLLRGHLAVESDKADFEKKQANEKSKQRQAAIDALNQRFGVPQEQSTPTQQGQAGDGSAQPAPAPQPQASPDMGAQLGTIAGGGAEFGPIVDKLLPMLQQEAKMRALQPIFDQYQHIATNDPKTASNPAVQKAFLMRIGAIDSDVADKTKKLFGMDKETTTVTTPPGGKTTVLDPQGNPVRTIEGNNPQEMKPIPAPQSTRAAFTASMANALPDMSDVMLRNPKAVADGYNKLLAMAQSPMIASIIANVKGAIPGIGGGLDDEQKFMSAAELWMQGKLGTDATKRFTAAQYRIYLQPFITQLGDTPATIKTKLGNLERATLSNIKSAQRAFDEEQWDVLKPEAQMYLQSRLGYTPKGAVATGNPFAGHPWVQAPPQ